MVVEALPLQIKRCKDRFPSMQPRTKENRFYLTERKEQENFYRNNKKN